MKIKIPVQIIELEKDNFHLIANGKFTDGKACCWAIDTGASKTVFDKNLENYYFSEDKSEEIQSAGIGEKLLITQVASLLPFSLGKYKIDNLRVALFDLSLINEFYRRVGGLEICGLIGGDFLTKHKAVIDYKRRILILTR